MDVGDDEACAVSVVLGEAAAAAEPCEGAFEDPSLGQHLETDRMIVALDDFRLPGAEGLALRLPRLLLDSRGRRRSAR